MFKFVHVTFKLELFTFRISVPIHGQYMQNQLGKTQYARFRDILQSIYGTVYMEKKLNNPGLKKNAISKRV